MKIKRAVLLIALLCAIGMLPTIGQDSIGIPADINVGTTDPRLISAIDASINASAWHGNPFVEDYEYQGQQIKIGILDIGFDDLDNLLERIPALRERIVPIEIGQAQLPPTNALPNAHGTHVFEIAASIAPQAEYYLCSYSNLNQYRVCVEAFVDNQLHVVIHSAGVPILPRDGTSQWSRLAMRANESGIVWVNSVGNFNSGIREENFHQTTERLSTALSDLGETVVHNFLDSSGNRVPFIEFNPTSTNVISSPVEYGELMLTWGDTNEQAATEYDLEIIVIEENGNVAFSRDVSDGTGNPIEKVSINLRLRSRVYIRDTKGNAEAVPFILITNYVRIQALPGVPINFVLTPVDNPFVVGVGALHVQEELATYSGVGTFTFRYPDNSTEIITKPDIVTIGEVQLGDGEIFVGTSAATPIVGGAVALLRQAYPHWNQEQIVNYLYFNSVVFDYEQMDPNPFGYGRLWLPEPPASPVEIFENAESVAGTIEGPFIATVNVPSGNIRIGPSTACEQRTVGEQGETFDIIGRYEDWFAIETEIGVLWIHSSIVDFDVQTLDDLPLIQATVCETQLDGPVTDVDNDGYPDVSDTCPNRGNQGYGVNTVGCPNPPTVTGDNDYPVGDRDSDGYNDAVDACPNQGNQGFGVNDSGCPNSPPNAPDSDGDGYPDTVDTCPNQGNQGFGVNDSGCPNSPPNAPDSDGDGYPDTVDTCPNQGDQGYGVAGNGCPNPPPVADSDGDGYNDAVDACPNQGDQGFGVAGNGCPNPPPVADSDGDGVPDTDDQCPDVAGHRNHGGCQPGNNDSDNDGVNDNRDACPDRAGSSDNNGCPSDAPDRDSDGVPDTDDQCPDVAGHRNHGGCPPGRGNNGG